MTADAPPACFQYRSAWLSDSDRLMAELTRSIEWEQPEITIFGRTVPTPRLTAWMGDTAYAYSGVVNEPRPWPPPLLDLRHRLVAEIGAPFNSCLANLYRDGSDSMGYHSDDEPELGERPVIASLSLGARRRFAVRHRVSRERWTFDLGAGDLLIMRGESQRDYAHGVAKTSRAVGQRMNLTFRCFATVGGLPGGS